MKTYSLTRVSSLIREDARLIVQGMSERLQALRGKTVLVTGAIGFIGSYFLDVLTALNDGGLKPACRVTALDNFKTGVPDRVEHLRERKDIHFLSHDIKDPLPIKERVDFIIHAASIASPTFYRRFPLETIDTNVNGTRHLLDLARKGIKSMLFLSTSEVYGDPDPDHIPTREDYRGNVSCTGPRASYDESKRLAETLCMTYHRLYKIPVKMVRPFNVYGPGLRLDDQRIIPDLLSSVLHQEPIVLYSDGKTSRSFCYVRDAIRGMLCVLLSKADGEAFNVGNDEEITIGCLAEKMADLAAPPRISIEYRMSEDSDYLTDNPQRRQPDLRKLRSLNWVPEVSLSEGLTRTIRSYRELMKGEASLVS